MLKDVEESVHLEHGRAETHQHVLRILHVWARRSERSNTGDRIEILGDDIVGDHSRIPESVHGAQDRCKCHGGGVEPERKIRNANGKFREVLRELKDGVGGVRIGGPVRPPSR